MKPLSMNEAKKIIEEHNGREEIQPYFKKFITLNNKEASELRKDLEALNNHKMKQEHIVKIIDFLPGDASEMNKIFTDVSLDEGEIKEIKEIVAKYK